MSDPSLWFRIEMYLWTALFLYWIYAARQAKKSVRKESILSRLSHSALLAVAYFLLFEEHYTAGTFLDLRILPDSDAMRALGTLVTFCGITYAIWARISLGTNWSGRVTLKADHQLIRSGPYRFSRHPIYTGLGIATLGTAMTVGELRTVFSIGLMVIAFLRKMSIEERLLLQQFPDQYPVYAREVKRLIPFIY